MKYDLHLHSKYSIDSNAEIKDIISTAIKKDYSGIAITDHNTIKAAVKAKEYETENFKIIIGSEISTDKGEIIGLFLSDEIKSREFYSVISEIKNQNGIVLAPHPFDSMRNSLGNLLKLEFKLVDCIEGFNSRCISQSYNNIATEFSKENNIPSISGSDAHFICEIGNAGIIMSSYDLRNNIIKNNFKTFGKKTSILAHVGSKILKSYKKHENITNKLP